MPSNVATNTTNSGKYLDALPAWARELSEKYYSRSFALFVLYGNVRDLVPLRTRDATNFVPLDEFLSGALFGQRDIVLHYDRGGLNFGSADSQADFRRALCGNDFSFFAVEQHAACHLRVGRAGQISGSPGISIRSPPKG